MKENDGFAAGGSDEVVHHSDDVAVQLAVGEVPDVNNVRGVWGLPGGARTLGGGKIEAARRSAKGCSGR